MINTYFGPAWLHPLCPLGTHPHKNLESPKKSSGSPVALHSCLSEKFEMEAPQWKNALNTFLHRIIDLSWLFCLYNECLVCWWYIVVTHQILVVVIGHFHATAKLRRLCGQDSSFYGGYVTTKAYSRSDRLHQNVIWSSAHLHVFVIFGRWKHTQWGVPRKIGPYGPR